MIDFLITSSKHKVSFVDKWNIVSLSPDRSIYFINNDYFISNLRYQKVLIIGDCINKEAIGSIDKLDEDFVINKLKGNYYAFLINKDGYTVMSSAFGLLPIYYKTDYSIISSSVDLIRKSSKVSLTENKKWLVNQLLFNYQFGNETFFNEINLFPALSYLQIKNKSIKFYKYYEIRDSYSSQPKKWKIVLNNLSDLFIPIVRQYIPNDDSIISFTGGFDGRTLVAIATHYMSKFNTYSYGKIENDDVSIPMYNSKLLDIPYSWLNLGSEYYNTEYLKSATNFTKHTDGGNGFLYAHIDYSARKISEKSNLVISGACGSELFRAVHSSGAVTSQALIALFKIDIFDDYKEFIFNSDVFKYINKNQYYQEIESVIKQTWNYKLYLPDFLSKNQKLYVFVYEEIFRKFFGTWITAHMKYVSVRTPYIDYEFFKELIKSDLSGAYSDFLTNSPLKRFKGQVFYADVIKKTNSQIYKLKTGKGYSPREVREFRLRPKLLLPFILRRIKRILHKQNLDNLSIISGIMINKIELLKIINQSDSTINHMRLESALNKLSPFTKESERDTILTIFSYLIYRKL